jgi:hypothetical protein
MVVTAVNYGGTAGIGRLKFSSLTGQQTIPLFDPLATDITDAGALYLSAGDGLPTPFQATAFKVAPTLLVTSDLAPIPFTSHPEPSYKLGSWGYYRSVKVVVESPDYYYTVPYDFDSNWLNYPQQSLDTTTIIVVLPGWSALDYQIDMTIEPDPWTEYSTILRPSDFATNFGTAGLAMGLSLNLDDNITADLTVHYDFISFGWDETFLPVNIGLFV